MAKLSVRRCVRCVCVCCFKRTGKTFSLYICGVRQGTASSQTTLTSVKTVCASAGLCVFVSLSPRCVWLSKIRTGTLVLL